MSNKSNTINAINSNDINEFIQNAGDAAKGGNAYSRGQGSSFSATDVANMKLEQLQFEQEAKLNQQWWEERESVQGLRQQYEEAGFNPMLAATGGAGSSPSISTPTMDTQQPSQSGQGANTLGFIGQLLSLFGPLGNLINQSRATSAEVKNKNANTANLNADTDIKKTYAKFQSDLYRRSLSLTDAQIDNLRKDIDVKDAQIDKYFQDISESVARETDAYASAALKHVQADQIRQLIPYYIELVQAQTKEALGQAQANLAKAMLDQHIIDAKVYDAYAKQATAAASQSEAIANKSKTEADVISATKTVTVVGRWIDAIAGGIKSLTGSAVDVAAIATPGGAPILQGVETITETFNSKGNKTGSTRTSQERIY